MLDQFNNEKAVSAICYKIRASELVEGNLGSIDKEKLVGFSTDHKYEPGENSICRHSKNPVESETVSAAIMEIEKKHWEIKNQHCIGESMLGLE